VEKAHAAAHAAKKKRQTMCNNHRTEKQQFHK